MLKFDCKTRDMFLNANIIVGESRRDKTKKSTIVSNYLSNLQPINKLNWSPWRFETPQRHFLKPKSINLKDGAAGENRTHDPILTKDVLYHWATAASETIWNLS